MNYPSLFCHRTGGKFLIALFLCLSLLAPFTQVHAQALIPRLVADINPGSPSASPICQANVNGTLYFFAVDGIHGQELWKSDGNAAGTVLVKDINPGGGSFSTSPCISANGILFFTAYDGVHANRLWRSDGTEAGTFMLKDVTVNTAEMINFNGVLYFTGYDSIYGAELWKSDGTEAGTGMVYDIGPGNSVPLVSGDQALLTNANGTLYFDAYDSGHGLELWALTFNHYPVAANDTATTLQNTPVTINVLANDSDVDVDSLSVSAVGNAAHGTVTTTGALVTYTPNAGYVGADSFTYTINDSHGGVATATVNVTVTFVNHSPTANDQTLTPTEDTPKAVTLIGADVDGDALTFSVVSGPSHGSLSGTAPNLTYTPAANYNGADSFTFKANDGTADSNIATVNLTVTPVNDPPGALNDPVTTFQNTRMTVNVLANDSDVDGDSLSVKTLGRAAHGTVTTNGAAVTYTPATGYVGADSFTYTISDGHSGSATATVTVMVTQPPPATITIIHDAQPDSTTDFRFSGGLGSFRLDDITPGDGDAYSNSKPFTKPSGAYTVIESVPGLWYLADIVCSPAAKATVKLANKQVAISVSSGDNVICTFINQRFATLTARVYQDRNGNGLRDSNEPFQRNWAVNLYNNLGALLNTRVTNTAGTVNFNNLRMGQYAVCEVLQTGWFSTQPGVMDATYHQPCYRLNLLPAQVAAFDYGNNTSPRSASVDTGNAQADVAIILAPDIDADAYGYDGMPATEDVSAPETEQRIYLPLIER